MRDNITIEFEPKTTYKEWIFNGVMEKEKATCNLNFFCTKQIEEEIENILNNIPFSLLNALEVLNWKIIVTNTRNLEEECNSLKEIYGYTNFSKREIVVYATRKGINESLPHEIAHFLDSIINISDTKEWCSIYDEENETYKKMRFTFTSVDKKSECFADAFMMYINNETYLKRNLPKTYKTIENIFKYMDYLVNDDVINKIKYDYEKKLMETLSRLSTFGSDYNYD